MKITRTTIIFAAIVALAGIVFLAKSLFDIYSQSTTVSPTASIPPAPSQSTTTASSTPEATTPAVKPVAAAISYGAAVNIYKDTRMQFGPDCQATPSNMAIKNGTKIMLDNRAPSARTIAIGGVRYSLSAYGFRIVTMSYINLPRTLAVDCGTGRNNATIIVNR